MENKKVKTKATALAICAVLLVSFSGVVSAITQSVSDISRDEDEKSKGWYYKPPYPNYAPSGMPDFDQKQDEGGTPDFPVYWNYCGPTAVANCFWWIDSKYADPTGTPGDGKDTFPLVRDYNEPVPLNPGPNTDDHAFDNVNDVLTSPPPTAGAPPALPPFPEVPETGAELGERLAWCMDLDGMRTGDPHLGVLLMMWKSVSIRG